VVPGGERGPRSRWWAWSESGFSVLPVLLFLLQRGHSSRPRIRKRFSASRRFRTKLHFFERFLNAIRSSRSAVSSVGNERTSHLDSPAQGHVQRLDRVGRIDYFANLPREGEKRRDPLPVPPPPSASVCSTRSFKLCRTPCAQRRTAPQCKNSRSAQADDNSCWFQQSRPDQGF
jgi:hypothetical protein